MNILRDEQFNVTKVLGNFKSLYLILIFATGSEKDPFQSSGMSHLCEHYLLLYLEKELRTKVKFYGVTNFDHTLFYIRISNVAQISKIDKILGSFENSEIDSNLVLKAKKEIKKEFIYYNKEKKELFNFISKNRISELPIGNENSISKIKDDNIKRHIVKEYLKNFHILYLGKENVSIMNKSEFKLCKSNYYSYTENNTKHIKIKGNKSLKIYFNTNHVYNTKSMIEFCLLQYSLIYIVGYNCNPNFTVYSKRINNSNTLLYLEIDIINGRNIETIIEKILNYTREYILSVSDFLLIKEYFISTIKVLDENYIEQIVENIVNEILYNETSVISEKDVTNILKTIESIDVSDINKIKKDIFDNYHYAVVSEENK